MRDSDRRSGESVDIGRRGGGRIARRKALFSLPFKFFLKFLTVLFEMGAAAESAEVVILAILLLGLRQGWMRSR
jgi:hypothetical protein